MNRVLIDTCVWIDYFRSKKSAIIDEVNGLLDNDLVVLCGIVEMEILHGVQKQEKTLITGLFSALHYIEAERDDFISAGEKLNILKKKGITIPAADCIIAMQCKRRGITLFSLDKDFDHITELKHFRTNH